MTHPPVQPRTTLHDVSTPCPWCGSARHALLSPFGGTLSEILFQCLDCDTPFGLMKWETLDAPTT